LRKCEEELRLLRTKLGDVQKAPTTKEELPRKKLWGKPRKKKKDLDKKTSGKKIGETTEEGLTKSRTGGNITGRYRTEKKTDPKHRNQTKNRSRRSRDTQGNYKEKT